MSSSKLTPSFLMIWVLGVGFGIAAQAQALTFKEYMEQVKSQSSAYRGASTQAEASFLKSREADLIFTPQLFADARVGYDAKPSSPPVMVYDKLATQNYKLGVSQQFNFGLQTRLYYDLTETDFVGANFGTNVPTKYWDASPKFEWTLPLWGGGFGRTARANEAATRQQNQAESFSNGAQAASLLVGAEAAYWRLSVWQDVVRIQEQALNAAQNIHDYVSRKQRMNLGEKSDVIQAQALLESRTLELQIAKNEYQDALRSLNRFRNAETYAPAANLESVDYKALENIVVPAHRPGDRLDVKATAAQLKAAKAASALVLERNRATLDLSGAFALYGRDEELNEALKKSGNSERDAAFVGLSFKMPLNVGASSDVKTGAYKQEKAAELNYQYATYAQEQDWANLTRNLSDARDNLRLIGRIEAVQKSKVENERNRLRQGRTTTYQVLLFEQDYTTAAVTRAKSAAQILGLQSQVKLYQAASSEGGN